MYLVWNVPSCSSVLVSCQNRDGILPSCAYDVVKCLVARAKQFAVADVPIQ